MKQKTTEDLKTYSLQLRPSVMSQVDAAQKKAGVKSRQKFIEAILEQVVNDPKFVLRIKE